MTRQVRVMRNPLRHNDQPWLVFCSLCAGCSEGCSEGGFLAGLFSPPLGWAHSWRVAQDFAQLHAIAHEKTRCTRCLHLPAEPLSKEAHA